MRMYAYETMDCQVQLRQDVNVESLGENIAVVVHHLECKRPSGRWSVFLVGLDVDMHLEIFRFLESCMTHTMADLYAKRMYVEVTGSSEIRVVTAASGIHTPNMIKRRPSFSKLAKYTPPPKRDLGEAHSMFAVVMSGDGETVEAHLLDDRAVW